MKRVFAVGAAVLGMLAFTTGAGAITYGVPDGDSHPEVGALLAQQAYSDGTWETCSGTLIAPHIFLTAAHCDEGVSRVAVTFDSSYVYPSGTTYWGTWHADPDYSQAQGDPHDLGCRGAGQGGQGHLLGVAVVGLHAGVFIANTVLLSSGGDVNALALLVPSAVAIVAAYLAVDGSRLRAG